MHIHLSADADNHRLVLRATSHEAAAMTHLLGIIIVAGLVVIVAGVVALVARWGYKRWHSID